MITTEENRIKKGIDNLYGEGKVDAHHIALAVLLLAQQVAIFNDRIANEVRLWKEGEWRR